MEKAYQPGSGMFHYAEKVSEGVLGITETVCGTTMHGAFRLDDADPGAGSIRPCPVCEEMAKA